jgi:hypothetical protein
MHSLVHVDARVSLDSDNTMSVPAQVPPAQAPDPAPPLMVPVPTLTTPTAAVPAHLRIVAGLVISAPKAAMVLLPTLHPPAGPTAPPTIPFPALPPVLLDLAPAPVIPMAPTSQSLGVDAFKLLQLDPIKDAKSYHAMYYVFQLYLRKEMFSTGHADSALMTDAANAIASRIWEFQLRLAVKDGLLHFLFESKGALYNGHGFKMLAALDQHCQPESVSNAFSCLKSLFNDVQGENKLIWE